jgi:hypothetical protein
MKTTPAGKGGAKKVQKPSTTALILNGVCGGGKRGRGPTLHKGAFLEHASNTSVQSCILLNFVELRTG